jgi:hypothetical protein
MKVVTWRSRLMAARPMGVHLPLAPALAMPSSTTSAVKCIACRHSCSQCTRVTEWPLNAHTSTGVVTGIFLLQGRRASSFAEHVKQRSRHDQDTIMPNPLKTKKQGPCTAQEETSVRRRDGCKVAPLLPICSHFLHLLIIVLLMRCTGMMAFSLT